ncbi:MAG: hypothetical protein KGM42_08635 [Hyphomicrobiales bacterium]|nr:hypothetical protein [Hyphomicrobiales bacterium]
MQTKCAALLSALLLANLTIAAHAQGTAEQRSDCMGDAFKFCGADIPDVPKIEACLKSNLGQLTPACRSEFEPTQKTRLVREHFRK